MNIEMLLKGIDDCVCGKQHECPMDHVIIGNGILSSLNDICEKYQSILMVSDQNTYRVCGKEVAEILGGKITTSILFETGNAPLIPDEEAIDAIHAKFIEGVDLVLGVGSGVINDLCKIVSFEHELPYYIVATAPSMDGYASVGSALILKGMKVTLNAAPPKAIIADTKVLKDAPMDMLQAGYGDIIGKYSCLNDWKLSALINGEYFCQKVYDITYEMADKVKGLAEGVVKRDEEAVGALMEALVVVGIAMAYVGNSRPASGSEHHFSHYFEITGILTGKPYLAHGIDVVYAAVLTAKIREEILSSEPVRREFDEEEWKSKIERIYLTSTDEVIALQKKLGWYWEDNSEKVLPKWNEIKELLAEAPTEAEMLQMVEAVGMNYQEFVDLYGQEKIEDGVLYAKDLKDRYSVLWLYYEFFRGEK
ncbi:MAG: sn-glycerol-1-phosphate dehydrogenase [Tyzzerella sp.]|nr:sn-glycerol-1-phosphate dehydrogenase [Tyzzerella sp.]